MTSRSWRCPKCPYEYHSPIPVPVVGHMCKTPTGYRWVALKPTDPPPDDGQLALVGVGA